MARGLYDVFICHASEDKESLVRPLAQVLKSIGVSVWYDEFVVKPTDVLLTTVSDGIQQSEYGLVVLSKAFFQKRPWPMLELGALLQRKFIFIWHGVSAREVEAFFPPLAGIVAFSSSQPLVRLAEEIDKIVKVPLGKVWEDVLCSWRERRATSTSDPQYLEVADELSRSCSVVEKGLAQQIGLRERYRIVLLEQLPRDHPEVVGVEGIVSKLRRLKRMDHGLRHGVSSHLDDSFARLIRMRGKRPSKRRVNELRELLIELRGLFPIDAACPWVDEIHDMLRRARSRRAKRWGLAGLFTGLAVVAFVCAIVMGLAAFGGRTLWVWSLIAAACTASIAGVAGALRGAQAGGSREAVAKGFTWALRWGALGGLAGAIVAAVGLIPKGAATAVSAWLLISGLGGIGGAAIGVVAALVSCRGLHPVPEAPERDSSSSLPDAGTGPAAPNEDDSVDGYPGGWD